MSGGDDSAVERAPRDWKPVLVDRCASDPDLDNALATRGFLPIDAGATSR